MWAWASEATALKSSVKYEFIDFVINLSKYTLLVLYNLDALFIFMPMLHCTIQLYMIHYNFRKILND